MEIKPCPFCGSDEAGVEMTDNGECYTVVCENGDCEAEGPVADFSHDAIDAWNDRYEQES